MQSLFFLQKNEWIENSNPANSMSLIFATYVLPALNVQCTDL